MFELAKTLGMLADVRSLLFVLLILGTVLLWTRARRLGRVLVTLATLTAAVLVASPLGGWALAALEARFPPPGQLPAKIDGIVVLGGDFDATIMAERPVPSFGHFSGARVVAFAALARRYPEAKLVYSGGSGRLAPGDHSEAAAAARLLVTLGIDPVRVIFEDRSRNTYENALLSRTLAGPRPNEQWLLVTSAYHMPRAVGVFRALGWPVTAYPVDYRTPPEPARPDQFRFDAGMRPLGMFTREWTGLVIYRLLGYTNALYPAP